MTTQTVTIRYKVDSSGAVQATGAVVKTVTQIGTAAASTNRALATQQRQISSIQGALKEYTQNLRSLFGLYLSFQGVQTFARFIDEYTNLNGRLKVVIDNTQKYAVAQTQVYAIAQATYSSLSATANLYARLTVSLEELNSSQNEVAQITKTVNQALLVSGATSAEASSAIIQLSQSFASGVLRGEEFNAVNEAAPRIMTALAKSLGVSRGALREMASEGKLTAEVLRKALVDDALNIAKEAENVPLTIGRGYERLRNDLLQYVGAADSVYGVSRKVAESLVWLGQNLQQVAGYVVTAFQAVVLFSGAKGLLSIVGAATKAAQAGALLSTAFAAIGGWPVLIAAAVTALVLFRNELFTVSEVAAQASESLDRLKILMKVDPGAAAQLAVDNYRMLETEINKVSTALKEQQALIDSKKFTVATQDDFNKLDNLKAQLDVLTVQFEKAGAAFDGFNNHAQRTSRAAGSGTDAITRYANAQRTFTETLVASGTPLGRQIKAAEELKAGLLALDQQSRKGIATTGMEETQRRQLLATYQKEVATIGKSTEVKKKSVASDLARASATERLNNIIAQFSREQDDANKVLKQLSGVQLEVNSLVGKHPKLAGLAAQATKLIAEAAAEASDKFREFKESVKSLLKEFGQGNINKASADLTALSIALDEALASGNSNEANRILDAMRAIEEQAGLSASAATALRTANQELAAAAKAQSEEYTSYWEGAFGTLSNVIGEFVADGMRDWKSFGDSLKGIAKKIIADIIAEFIKLRVLNPIFNQLFGATQSGLMRPTGGGGLLGSLLGSSGSSGSSSGGSNIGGLLGSIGGLLGGTSTGFGTGLLASGSIFSGAGLIGGITGSISAGVSSILGGSIMQGIGMLAGPVGLIVGAVTLLTSLIKKDKPPDFRVGGSNASIRNREGNFSTVFGNVQAGSRQISWESLVEPMQQFDLGIQQLVNTLGGGQPQIAAITTALSTWEVDLRGSAATAENVLGSRFNTILTTFSEDAQNFVGTAGTLQERLGRLTDALTVEAAVKDGGLGDVFASVADLLVDYRIGTESLADTYSRVLGSVQLLDGVVAITGVSFDTAREDFIRFSADIVEAAGGLERASQLWQGYFQTFYSEEERQAYAIQTARSNAGTQLADIGLNITNFEGDGALAQFRQLFEAALPTLSAEATVQWLQAADALGTFVTAVSELNTVIEQPIEAITSLADLMSTVSSELADFSTDTLTFAERIQVLNSDIEDLVRRATALGASEEQIATIRELGQRRLGVILAEQRVALNAYNGFIQGFRSDPAAGLSDFQVSLQRIAAESSAAAVEANRLAVAAGLTGAATGDLALIQQHAAELAARAALELEASILSLAGQLGYFAEEVDTAFHGTSDLGFARWLEQQSARSSLPAIDPERYSLAVTLGQQIRELVEFTGDSVFQLMDRLQIPFDSLMADFGVSIQNIGNPEIFDRLASASRAMGIELADAASQLGTSIGELSDASSILNDGFERAVRRLPTAVSTQLTNLLRQLETAIGPEAQAAAQRQLSDFINAQPPAIRDALAPYLENVDTTSTESQLLAGSEQTNRYLASANSYLERIAANTGAANRAPTAGGPLGTARPFGAKETPAEAETNRLLRVIVSELQNIEKEQRSSNVKSKVGINNG